MDAADRNDAVNTHPQVVDDGSTDGSGDIAKRYAADDSRVVVHSYPENRRWAAVNETLERLGDDLGDYVARMDCDDVCMPERLATQEKSPEDAAVAPRLASPSIFPDGR